jgi:predicted DNA-binding transcriptional regulator AlpA
MKKIKNVKQVRNVKKKAHRPLLKIRMSRKKRRLLSALEQTGGLVATACQAVGISRAHFYNYLNDDKEFREKVKEVDEREIDFTESQLKANIREGKEASIFFHLKCKGKHRGYVEKTQMEIGDIPKKQKTVIGGREIEFE